MLAPIPSVSMARRFERPKSRACNVDLTQGGEWQREDDPVIDLVENLGIAGQRQPHLSILASW